MCGTSHIGSCCHCCAFHTQFDRVLAAGAASFILDPRFSFWSIVCAGHVTKECTAASVKQALGGDHVSVVSAVHGARLHGPARPTASPSSSHWEVSLASEKFTVQWKVPSENFQTRVGSVCENLWPLIRGVLCGF
jgi:hypothetical protein